MGTDVVDGWGGREDYALTGERGRGEFFEKEKQGETRECKDRQNYLLIGISQRPCIGRVKSREI